MKSYAVSLQNKKGLSHERALMKLEKYESNLGRKFGAGQAPMQQKQPRAYAMQKDNEPDELNLRDENYDMYEEHPYWGGEARAYQAGYGDAKTRVNKGRAYPKRRGYKSQNKNEEKKNKPCPYQAQGHCKKGDYCDWSHDEALIGAERRNRQNRIGKPPEANAYMAREPNDFRDVMATLELEEREEDFCAVAYNLEEKKMSVNQPTSVARAYGMISDVKERKAEQPPNPTDGGEWVLAYYDTAASKTFLQPAVFDRVFKTHQTRRGTLRLNSANASEKHTGRLEGTHVGGGDYRVRRSRGAEDKERVAGTRVER